MRAEGRRWDFKWGMGGRERSSVSLQDYSVELGSVDELAWGLK